MQPRLQSVEEGILAMTGSILLSAIVGASVSFVVAVFYQFARETKGHLRDASSYRSREKEIWE